MSEVAIRKHELPDSWAVAPLGEVIQLQYGKGLTAKTRVESGDVPVFGSSGDVGRHNEAYINEPCIIVGRKGNVGHIFISHKPCWPIDTVYYVIPPQGVDIKYLYYQLKNLNLARLDKSTAIPGINRNDAYKVDFNLAPIEQQKRIVAKIEELFSHIDAGIEALNKAKQLLKQYRQSVLKAAVTGELTKEWREQNKDKLAASDKLVQQLEMSKKNHNENVISRWEEAKKKWKEQGEIGKRPGKPKVTNELLELDEDLLADLPSLPDTWAWVLLGDIGDAIDPQPSHRTPPKVEDGIPYIGIGDVDKVKGEINFENARKVSSDVLKEHAIRYDLKEGDFIIGKIGTIGKPFQIPIERFYTLSANVVLVCPNTSLIEPGYLFNLCKSPLIEYQFDSGSKATTQAAFGIKKVRLLAVPFCSIEEQKIIVQKMEECLEKAGRLDAELDHQLLKAEKNKQSILASVFRGNL